MWGDARHTFATKLPSLLQPRPLLGAQKSFDKAFAAAWLGASDLVLVGTKCNALLLVDARAGSYRRLDLPPEPAVRPGGAGPFRIARAGASGGGGSGSGSGSGSVGSAGGIIHAAAAAPSDGDSGGGGGGFVGVSGHHAVAVSPDGALVVTGGRAPADAVVWRCASMSPLRTFSGHADCVFGADWVTDRHFATAGRDGTVKLFSVGGDESGDSGGGGGDDGDGGEGGAPAYDPEPAAPLASVLPNKRSVSFAAVLFFFVLSAVAALM